MIINGSYGEAKVFTDIIEESAHDQIANLMDQSFVEGRRVRIMPDVHAGKGCVIGTTMEIVDQVSPSLVGVDLGCGVLCVQLIQPVDVVELDRKIRSVVPSGYSVHTEQLDMAKGFEQYFHGNFRFGEYTKRDGLSLGTLGGGNHFLEVAVDGEGRQYLLVHSGSRNLGVRIATYYQDRAFEAAVMERNAGRQEVIDYLLKTDPSKIETALANYPDLPAKELVTVKGQLYDDYLHDMKLAQEYAALNRYIIARQVLSENRGRYVDTVHNYIEVNDHISMLRKGAVSAKGGETLVIPMNMRDGTLLCRGKGNPDWNYSAPHGAGRVLSRGQAKSSISLEDFQASMEGIYSTSVSNSTIDEAPMAYKPMEVIMDAIGDTVEIIDVLRPIYNFKK